MNEKNTQTTCCGFCFWWFATHLFCKKISKGKLLGIDIDISLNIQNPPNTLWDSVWNPPRPSQEMFGGSKFVMGGNHFLDKGQIMEPFFLVPSFERAQIPPLPKCRHLQSIIWQKCRDNLACLSFWKHNSPRTGCMGQQIACCRRVTYLDFLKVVGKSFS